MRCEASQTGEGSVSTDSVPAERDPSSAFASRRHLLPQGEKEEELRRRRGHHLRQELLALGLRAIALHGRGEALQDAVFERGDDGVVHIALAADRRRVRQFIGGGADGFQYLFTPAAGAFGR